MKVLVIGKGGREHTLVWKIVQELRVEKVYCIPAGNVGIEQLADCRSISLETNFAEVADFVEAEKIDLTVVGPEDPLAAGLVDVLAITGADRFVPDIAQPIITIVRSIANQPA